MQAYQQIYYIRDTANRQQVNANIWADVYAFYDFYAFSSNSILT